jgi:hypothetical protein
MVGVRFGGDHILALAGGLQLPDSLACVDEHLPIFADHHLRAERAVTRSWCHPWREAITRA